MVALAGSTVSVDPLNSDKFAWVFGRGGLFRVRDAYRLSRGHNDQSEWKEWTMLWKMKVQERVKIFFWIMSHKKLMTNKERWKQRIAASPLCGRCHREEEGVLHAIRDCRVEKEVWSCIIEPTVVTEFLLSRFERLASVDFKTWEATRHLKPLDGVMWRCSTELG